MHWWYSIFLPLLIIGMLIVHKGEWSAQIWKRDLEMSLISIFNALDVPISDFRILIIEFILTSWFNLSRNFSKFLFEYVKKP